MMLFLLVGVLLFWTLPSATLDAMSHQSDRAAEERKRKGGRSCSHGHFLSNENAEELAPQSWHGACFLFGMSKIREPILRKIIHILAMDLESQKKPCDSKLYQFHRAHVNAYYEASTPSTKFDEARKLIDFLADQVGGLEAEMFRADFDDVDESVSDELKKEFADGVLAIFREPKVKALQPYQPPSGAIGW